MSFHKDCVRFIVWIVIIGMMVAWLYWTKNLPTEPVPYQPDMNPLYQLL